MRVCMLTTSYPRHAGDHAGSFVFGLARELVKKEIQLTVVAPHDIETQSTERVSGIRVRRFRYFFPKGLQGLCYGGGIPANLRRRPWVALQIPFLLLGFLSLGWSESRNCSLVHAQWSLAGLAGLMIARLRKIPFVLTMHGAEVFANRGTILTRFILNRADYLITNSTFTLNRILEIANPRSYSVIPSGVNPEKWRDVSPGVAAHVREKWSIPEPSSAILFVGRLVERKGLRFLIDALPQILDKHPEAHAVVVGAGPLRQQLETQVQHLNIRAQITFTGPVPEEELGALYKMASMFILPSVYDSGGDTEGLGVVLLEAMANGLAVIASQVGGITDIISSQEVGLLVEPGDSEQIAEAILGLLDDPARRQTLGDNGRRKVYSDFSWDHISSQTIRIYQAVSKQKTAGC